MIWLNLYAWVSCRLFIDANTFKGSRVQKEPAAGISSGEKRCTYDLCKLSLTLWTWHKAVLVSVPFVLALMAVDQLPVFSWATHGYVVGLYQPVQNGQNKDPRTVSILAVGLESEAAAEQSTRLTN